MLNIAPDRLKTGVLLIAGLSIILLMNSMMAYFLLFVLINIASVYETRELYKIEDVNFLYVLVLVISFASLFIFKAHYVVLSLLLLLASFYAYKGDFNYKIFKAVLYPLLPLSFFFSFVYEYNVSYLIWIITIVAVSDIGAYIVGKNIGKTPFSPTSPNKTLEGVIGAIVLATIIGAFVGDMIIDSFIQSFIISSIISIVSIFGDLFESYLKRQADIKDSGDLLPGHGGVLDRLDGFLFALPMFYIILDIAIFQ